MDEGLYESHLSSVSTSEAERKERPLKYGVRVVRLLQSLWEASGYLWSRRLKAALPLWMPWVRRRFKVTAEQERPDLSGWRSARHRSIDPDRSVGTGGQAPTAKKNLWPYQTGYTA
ncbi:MAG: hypothetical protein HYR55_03275 [Acidobacteria bacterium]|nr:hypothetical protein [Acidobacteriota bacterium]